MERLPMDYDLGMVKEPPKDFLSTNHLRELRFRAVHDPNRPPVSSVPKGPLLFRLTDLEIKDYAMQQANTTPDQKLRQHLAANGDY